MTDPREPAHLFDRAMLAIDTDDRTCDLTQVMTLVVDATAEELHQRLVRGYEKATEVFPRATKVLVGSWWCAPSEPGPPLALVRGTEEKLLDEIHAFLTPPLDVRRTMVLQMLYFAEDSRRFHLVTRVHRALADGVSAFMLLELQLSHALGRPLPAESFVTPLELMDHPAPARRSKYAYAVPPSVIAERREIAGGKKFRLLRIPSEPLRATIAANDRRFTYNDLFCALIFEALERWAPQLGKQPETWRPAMRVPMNVRKVWHEGFGNGSTGVTVYSEWAKEATFADRCASVREQVRWGKENGSWHRGGSPWMMKIPFWMFRMMFGVLRRAPAARVTLFFSHLERQSKNNWEELFPEVERLFIVGPLMRAQPLVIIAITYRGVTNLSIAYNEKPLGDAAIDQLVSCINSVVAERGVAPVRAQEPKRDAPEPVGAIEVQSI